MSGPAPGAASTGRRTLRSQITIALSVTLLVPVALLLAAGEGWARRERAASEDRLQAVAETAMSAVDAYLESHRSAIRALADAMEPGPLPPARLGTMLDRARGRHPGFLTMLVADSSGTIVAGSPATTGAGERVLRRSVADRPYFIGAMAGRDILSGVFTGRGFGSDNIVAISSPLRDASGHPAGVVEGSLRLAGLSRAESQVAQQGMRVVIVDSAGLIVYGGAGGRYAALSPVARTPLALIGEGAGPPVQAFDDSLPDGGATRMIAARATSSASGWRVYVALAEAEALRGVRDFTRAALAVTALVWAIAVALTWWVSRRATRTLSRVADAASAFSLAEALHAPVSLAPADAREVAQLAGAFDAMRDRIERQLSGIIPICASCKRVHGEGDEWGSVESYISRRSQAEFSHGICPDCRERLYPGM